MEIMQMMKTNENIGKKMRVKSNRATLASTYRDV